MKRNDWIYATQAQEAYIRRLRAEVNSYRTAKWPRSSRRLLKSEASREIDMLRQAIDEGKAARNSQSASTQGE